MNPCPQRGAGEWCCVKLELRWLPNLCVLFVKVPETSGSTKSYGRASSWAMWLVAVWTDESAQARVCGATSCNRSLQLRRQRMLVN